MFSNPRIAAKSFARLDERKGSAHSIKRTLHQQTPRETRPQSNSALLHNTPSLFFIITDAAGFCTQNVIFRRSKCHNLSFGRFGTAQVKRNQFSRQLRANSAP